MRTRLARLIPAVAAFGIVAAAPTLVAAQTARLEPYHMLLGPGQPATVPVENLSDMGSAIRAQTGFVPYFGKNQVQWDTFDWHIYKTDHFEIYFYPAMRPHLEQVASYAESAYQHISSTLKHDLAQRVPLIIFKSEAEFQENQIAGGETPEGVLGFSEPERNRVVIPIDNPPDQLYSLITHELTHIFEFDIIPRGIVGTGLPLWVDEGLADYMTGAWNALDLMSIRDAALTDSVPKMSHLEEQPLVSGRTPYDLGHAAFEFIEAKWGMDGLRQFLFSLRKSVLGGGESAYEEALKVKPEDFDEQFDRYLKDRFKPFRDKERPADYGKSLAPDPEKTPYVAVLSIEPSPTGEMLAALTANAHDEEYDVLLVSAKDGKFISNLTKGFDKDRGWDYLALPGGMRGGLVPTLAWAPFGDRLAYFVRTEKERTLIVENVVTAKTERRIDLKEVDGPESPAFSPDGKLIAFSALQNGSQDIFTVNIDSHALVNVTKDAIADYSPVFAPDGKSIIYTARIGASDKLFRVDLSTGTKSQLTFGSQDDTAARFYDDHTIVFTSTAVDPKLTLTPEVAANGDIPNVWTLNLSNGMLTQWTDTLTANTSPVVLNQAGSRKIAFVTYYKGEYGIHAVSSDKTPIATASVSDFGGPGPIVDFTAPVAHTVIPENIRKKGAWEKMSMEGRPPISLGFTSGGNIYGDTELNFGDVLGDKQISFYAQSVAQFRTTAFTYVNTSRRLQYAFQGFSADTFYYAQNLENSGALYDPVLAPLISRDLAQSVSSQRGGTMSLIYPLSRYTRVELSTGYEHLNEHYTDDTLQQLALQYQIATYGQPLLRDGSMIPFGVSLVNETTVFREYGPVAGSTMKVTYSGSPSITSSWISRQTLDGDIRRYYRLAANGVFALRFRGLDSWGRNPDFLYFGGNSEMHGYDYLQFLGQRGFFADAELRFPFINAVLTPFGVIGGVRGVFFANFGGAGFQNQPFTLLASKSSVYNEVTGYTVDSLGDITNTQTTAVNVNGFRLVDGRASYGFGLESFLLGFPMHFDWSWRTLLNKAWEDVLFPTCTQTGAAQVSCTPDGNGFRKPRFDFWIGYDF